MTREIRVLAEGEVGRLVDWAGEEGWNPGIGDAHAFRGADPDGFLGCFVDGEMVSGIAAVAYGEAFGFIGLYICRPDGRGKGYGRAVWDAGMRRLGARTVGLDGVPGQQANYRKMGFAPAYETLRFAGRPDFGGAAEAACAIEPFGPQHLEAVLRLDRECFPAGRPRFMTGWLQEPRRAVVAVRCGGLEGFGAVRRCRSGHKVGPLFATGDGAARAILQALGSMAAGDLSVDVPERQDEFSRTLAASGMEPGFRTARMYRGAAPETASRSVYGVTTLELG
jgi:hypothetical protein